MKSLYQINQSSKEEWLKVCEEAADNTADNTAAICNAYFDNSTNKPASIRDCPALGLAREYWHFAEAVQCGDTLNNIDGVTATIDDSRPTSVKVTFDSPAFSPFTVDTFGEAVYRLRGMGFIF